MRQVIQRKITKHPHKRTGCAKYYAQEPVGDDSPDIRRPPDIDIDIPDDDSGIPAPPFTGEDVEPRQPDVPLPM